nr:MAG TPA: hypothetical protein [Caudoviricetes sp.]
MRMKYLSENDLGKKYQLGSYQLFILHGSAKILWLYKNRACNAYVPDILCVNDELKIQQNLHWGAVNVRQAEAIIEGYKEAIEVLKFMERFLK